MGLHSVILHVPCIIGIRGLDCKWEIVLEWEPFFKELIKLLPVEDE